MLFFSFLLSFFIATGCILKTCRILLKNCFTRFSISPKCRKINNFLNVSISSLPNAFEYAIVTTAKCSKGKLHRLKFRIRFEIDDLLKDILLLSISQNLILPFNRPFFALVYRILAKLYRDEKYRFYEVVL